MTQTLRKTMGRKLADRPLWQHLCALLAILAVCVGVFFWAGYTYLPDAADQSRRQIVNDDYGVLTEPLGADGEIRQAIWVEGRLYGVVLDVTTYGQVAQGTLHLRLLDATGNQVAACDTDMTALLDNTFHRFLFDSMVDAGEGGSYTIVLSSTPHTADDLLGFYRSDGPAKDFIEEGADTAQYPLEDFTLTQDGGTVDGTLALQYTLRYVGGLIYNVYAFFAALLTVFLLALYALLFIFKAPLHRVFVLCALVLGFVFMFLIPPRTAPDEYNHISSSYHYSNIIFGTAENDVNNNLSVRRGDEMKLHNYDFDATDIFAWQDLYEGLFEPAPGGGMVTVPAYNAHNFAPQYLAPTIGVVLARLLGLGQVGLLLLGRLANLVFYTVLVSRAIKRMPLAKPMMFCAALLPAALQLAASFSYDTYLIALCFYFIAACLDYALKYERVGWQQVLLLAVLAALIAPAKAIYVVVVLWVLIIPKSKYPTPRFALGGRALMLAVAVLVWGAFNLVYLQVAAVGQSLEAARAEQYVLSTGGMEGFWDEDASPAASSASESAPVESAPVSAVEPSQDGASAVPDVSEPAPATGEEQLADNGDALQYYSFGYILRNIPGAVKVLLNSLWQQSSLWLQGLIGGRLGEIIAIKIEVNWLFVLGLVGVLGCAALPDSADKEILSRPRRLGAAGIVAAVFALMLLASLTWTPINYTTLFGMQGRYLLPVLPLLLLALRGSGLAFKKPVGNKLAATAVALCVLCQLDAFIIILQR